MSIKWKNKMLRSLQKPLSTRAARRLLGHRKHSFTKSTVPCTAETSIPSTSQLRTVAFRAAIPMVGFGFMDNLVMIQAGEAIDMSLGVAFGLSTMAAAGFGQCISDVAGFTSGGIVDAFVAKLNLPQHGLSPQQLDLKICRMYITAGGCAGVVLGCLMGMTSLLFMDTDRADRAKKAKELQSIFETVMNEVTVLVKADVGSLWILDEAKGILWTRVTVGQKGVIEIPVKTGLVGACIEAGEAINIVDAYNDKRFHPSVDKKTGYHTKSVICLPVKGSDGTTRGAIQMINKKGDDGNIVAFDDNDEKLLQMLASHVAAFTRIVQGSD
jgi:putative methionine-R-sulfoxide reductase with GAF domain